MRTAVALVCGVTIAASCFLALSYLLLKGPFDLRPLSGLAVFVGLSAIGLFASLVRLPRVWALIPTAAAAAIAWTGATTISHSLSGPHFEGYALVLGALGIVQGILALALTGSTLKDPAAARHS
jgi:uncharacterized BrkB/YihY/UPF0761 family membrane protein